MASKSDSTNRPPEDDGGDPSQAVRDSAQKIWLAGLGAFERARTEGPRMFESLVEQGRNMGARAVGMADDALRTMREADYSGNRWEKLEQAFEDRVSKSLSRLGVLTARDVDDLVRQVRELNEHVRDLMSAAAEAPAATAAGTARTTRKSASRPKGASRSKAPRAKRPRAPSASRVKPAGSRAKASRKARQAR